MGERVAEEDVATMKMGVKAICDMGEVGGLEEVLERTHVVKLEYPIKHFGRSSEH